MQFRPARWPLAAAAVLAACNSGPSNDIDTLSLDVAAAAGETAAQNVEMMRGPGGPHGFGVRFDPASFDCEPRTREGLTVTLTCSYADAAGARQSAYDANTTATVTIALAIKGSFDRGPMTGKVDRTSSLVVTGLAGAETKMTWNGTDAGTMSHSHGADDNGKARSYQMSYTGTTINVVIPVPRTETSWPLSGTTTQQATIKFTGGKKDGQTETRTVTTSYNGTQFITVTVNGETFTVDLAKRGRAERGRGKP